MIKVKYDFFKDLEKANLHNSLSVTEAAVFYVIDIEDKNLAKKLSDVLLVSDFNSLEKEKIDEEVKFEIKTKGGIFYSIPTYFEITNLITLAIRRFLLDNGGSLLPNDVFDTIYKEAYLAFKNISKDIYINCKNAVFELSTKKETVRLISY